MLQIFTQFWWQYLTIAVASYLFGSINYSVIFSRSIKKGDIRKFGSGNAGTTNMFRVYGLPLGVLTFSCDTLKGVLVCLATKLIFPNINALDGGVCIYLAGLFAVVGHIFPVFFKFNGGKGFATSIGICAFTQPIFTLCVAVVIIASIFIWDKMSLSALLFETIVLLWHWIFCDPQLNVYCCVLVSLVVVLVFVAHRQNIVRLVTGREPNTGVVSKFTKKK
jgi:glycerol-3-phosphate acyltransferase PlsY